MQEHGEVKRYNISAEHWVSRTKTCGNRGNPVNRKAPDYLVDDVTHQHN